MKKYVQKIIDELKFIYPNEIISIQNGFIGIKTKEEHLKHTTYIGNQYFELDGFVYTDYNGPSKKLMKI